MLLRLVSLAMLVLLSACATRPTIPDAAPESIWLKHRETVQTLHTWQLQGRVAIRNQAEGWNASFDWQQVNQRYRIRLRGPFGQGAVELHGDPQGVWLKRTGKPSLYARNSDELLAQETGWQLPVTGLVSWLRGLPDASTPADLQWDSEGLLTNLKQQGWQISFRRYRHVGERRLPDKLQLERDKLRVKVVVDSWQTP